MVYLTESLPIFNSLQMNPDELGAVSERCTREHATDVQQKS